ncbi:MAG: copper chaperone PCu(A)C, partial [Chloroflexota bacterium]
MKHTRWISWLLLVVILAACSAGGAAPSGGIQVRDAWVRAAGMGGNENAAMGGAMGGNENGAMGGGMHGNDNGAMGAGMGGGMGNSAAYMLLVNAGLAADRLVAARCDCAQAVEIHMTEIVNDVMTMRPVEGGLEVPAGGQAEWKPGSYHV